MMFYNYVRPQKLSILKEINKYFGFQTVNDFFLFSLLLNFILEHISLYLREKNSFFLKMTWYALG